MHVTLLQRKWAEGFVIMCELYANVADWLGKCVCVSLTRLYWERHREAYTVRLGFCKNKHTNTQAHDNNTRALSMDQPTMRPRKNKSQNCYQNVSVVEKVLGKESVPKNWSKNEKGKYQCLAQL